MPVDGREEDPLSVGREVGTVVASPAGKPPIDLEPMLAGVFLAWLVLVGVVLILPIVFFSGAPPPVVATREVRIELSDFDIMPDVIDVLPDTELIFVVENVGESQHNLYVTAEKATPRLKTGETITLNAGVSNDSYFIWCDIKGHRELGMEAWVEVDPD